MTLVDIGNTHFHIYNNGGIVHLKHPTKIKGDVYYISVNEKKEKEFLTLNPKAVNLKHYVKFKTNYQGLGIDRIMACKPVKNGTVVDAGSAVTIDVMEDGVHKGGIITPGLYAFKKAFGTISEVLEYEISKPGDSLPLNTSEALNAGSVGAVVCLIKSVGKGMLHFTGSDGKFFSKIFHGSEYIEDLVFRGMMITIKEMEIK